MWFSDRITKILIKVCILREYQEIAFSGRMFSNFKVTFIISKRRAAHTHQDLEQSAAIFEYN